MPRVTHWPWDVCYVIVTIILYFFMVTVNHKIIPLTSHIHSMLMSSNCFHCVELYIKVTFCKIVSSFIHYFSLGAVCRKYCF
jgi:hypothetical protein